MKFLLTFCVLAFMFTGGEFYGEMKEQRGIVEFFTLEYRYTDSDQYGEYLLSRIEYYNHRIRLLGIIAILSVIIRIYLEYKRDKPNHWLYTMINKIKFDEAKL